MNNILNTAPDRHEFMARFIDAMKAKQQPGDFFHDADCEAYASMTGPIWWHENGADMSPEDCAEADLEQMRETERNPTGRRSKQDRSPEDV